MFVNLQIKTKIVICHTADSKPVKQEVNGTVILPPLVFPGSTNVSHRIHFYTWYTTADENNSGTKLISIFITNMCIHRQSICSAGMKEMSRECREHPELADSILVVCLWEQGAWHSYNGTARFKKCKQMFEYQHLLFHRDI